MSFSPMGLISSFLLVLALTVDIAPAASAMRWSARVR